MFGSFLSVFPLPRSIPAPTVIILPVKTEFPSGLQLIEQIVRVGSSYLLYLVCISEGTPVTAVIAAGGTLVSELVVAVLALLMISAFSEICA